MKGLMLASVLAVAAQLGMAQSTTWVSDPAHSEVDFSVTHLTIANVHGRFGKVDATVVYDGKDIAKASVKAMIDVAGISTGVEARDKHLKTPDFFDAANYPTATFVSTSISKSSGKFYLHGNLTLHGVTRPVVLTAEGPTGPVEGMDHKQHIGFTATATISRADFGIGGKFPTSVVGDAVKLSIELDVARQ